jgi:hypothetical protein
MTRRQRDQAVETHADLILAEEPSRKAYAAHFEAQMHRGWGRRLLSASYRWLTRAGTLLPGVPCGRKAATARRSA